MASIAAEVLGVAHGAYSRSGRRPRPAAHSRGRADPLVSLDHTITIPRRRPLAYGYVRTPRHDDAGDHHIRICEQRIRSYATAHDLDLAGICYSVHPGVGHRWIELVAELERAGARYVVVPSVDDLSSHPLLRLMMCDRLARTIQTDLVVLGDCA